MIQALVNHLWQSTLVVIVAGVWAWTFRQHSARLRYWLWFSATVKFLLPFSLLIALGSHLPSHPSIGAGVGPLLNHVVSPAPANLAFRPFATTGPTSPVLVAHPQALPFPWTAYLIAVWFCGAGLILGRWTLRWWRLIRTLGESIPLTINVPIAVRAAPTATEPGVVGVLRPVLVLPHAIEKHLSPDELRAVLLHELEHVRCGDNLTAALCMLVQALFWFYPLVWWLGRRLIIERESACDQAVLSGGCDREVYAQGIVNVCKLYVESPLACSAGVSGADLRKRIESIMTDRPRHTVGMPAVALLSITAAVTILMPISLGLALASTAAVAQAQAPDADTPETATVNGRTVITGAPFSAIATQEQTRDFTDGNHTVRTVRVTHLYRDSAGRTRVERELLRQTAGPKEELQSAAIQIYDPTLGERYILIPKTKTALVLKVAAASKFAQPPFSPAPITARWGGLTIGPKEQGWSQPESLGEQVMEGVRVIGTRQTFTLAAGAVGNEKPIGMTIEQWYSPDLGLIISKTNQGTAGGSATSRITELVQGEPDPSLFTVPADYTIRSQPRLSN